MRLFKNQKPSDRIGATTVEFAIVSPIFFLIVFTMFEFARLNVIRHTADNAAYEAARTAIVPGATAAEATAKANELLSILGTRGANITVSPSVISENTPEVTIEIDIPMGQNGWVAPKFTSGRTLHAESTLRTERVQTR